MEQVQNFYSELIPILEKHRDSLDKLVDGTQVSKVTVWRWLNGINRKYPDPNKVISLLSKISGQNKIKDIASYFGGQIESYLKNSYSVTLSESYNLTNDFQGSGLGQIKDFYTFLIYTICGNLGGASEKDLINTIGNIAAKKADIPKEYLTQDMVETYGLIAKKKIKELEGLEVLELKSDGKYHRTTKNMNFDSEIMKRYYPQMISDFFKIEDSHLGFNILCGYQETIPEKIANEIAKETKAFFLKCMKKMDEYSCEDGIPYQIINFGDKLNFETLNDPVKREVQ